MKHAFDLDVEKFLIEDAGERLNERITVPVSSEMYARLESLGKKKNKFIRTLLEQALPLVEKAKGESTQVA